MTEFALYREPTLLDSVKHRKLRLTDQSDYSMLSGLHSTLLTVSEFGAAAIEFPIVFVRDGAEGDKLAVSPCVVMGLQPGENLYVDDKRWNARYVPASIRRYPFAVTQQEGMSAPAVVFDAWWRGFSETDGEAMYTEDGKPTEKLGQVVKFLEEFGGAVAQSGAFCERLVELDLLQAMTATIKLADGTSYSLNGFFAVDEAKLRALPDATVLELHRNSMLLLLHTHLLSLQNLQVLVERKAKRKAAAH